MVDYIEGRLQRNFHTVHDKSGRINGCSDKETSEEVSRTLSIRKSCDSFSPFRDGGAGGRRRGAGGLYPPTFPKK